MACSFELRREVLGLLAEWGRQGRPCPPLGIGVHTGYVTVGNLGSAQRMAYTVVGRAVEIAERLAGAAPSGSILVSGRTRAVTEPELIFERRGDDLGSEVYEACAPRS
jgi:class 3 adenylate cyclase